MSYYRILAVALCHLCLTLTIFFLIILLSAPVQAETLHGSDKTAFEQAFRHSFMHPDDVDAAMRYAEEAVKLGDYEAAISPLERILMFNPKLSEVRMEVGMMYYLLGAMDMAKQHLTIVANDGNAEEGLRNRATHYLAKI